MKKHIILIAALCLMLLPGLLSAKPFGKVGTAALQFLKLGVDARAIGMGEAYTAVSDDISSVYWNPAGLAPAFENQAFASHTQWPANIMHDFVAGTYTNGVSTFAAYGSVLHMDDIAITDHLYQRRVNLCRLRFRVAYGRHCHNRRRDLRAHR